MKIIFTSAGISIAIPLTIGVTGVIFEAVHLHKYDEMDGKAIRYAVSAGIGGILCGALKEIYGLISSISAHTYFNTLREARAFFVGKFSRYL